MSRFLEIREFYVSFRVDQLSAFATIRAIGSPSEPPSFFLFGPGGSIDFSTRIDRAIYVNLLNLAGGGDVTGTAGHDRFVDSANNDVLRGGGGDDFFEQVAGGFDTILGGAGNDLFNIQSVAGIVDGGSGIDTLVAGGDISRLKLAGIETLRPGFAGLTATIAQIAGLRTVDSGWAEMKLGLTGQGGNLDLSHLRMLASTIDIRADRVVGEIDILGSSRGEALSGNRYVNRLDGQGGNDVLAGGGGRDILIGGAGNDTFVLNDDTTDVVSDASGIDTITSSVSRSLVGFGGIENLTLTGTGAVNGAGNHLANRITGNNAANILDGGLGRDVLVGGFGNDTYIATSEDIIQEWSDAAEGIDTVRSSTSFTLGGSLEHLVLTGSNATNGRGNELNNTLTGNAASNVLDGRTGADRLQGGAGNDTYVTDGGDAIVETAGQGIDTVRSSVSLTLGVNLENLVLTDENAVYATGNSLNNTITGSAGWNVLNGGSGSDRLIGGDGSDAYVTDGGDVIVEAANGGNDSVRSSVSIRLASNVEILFLTGGKATHGIGNNLDNPIYGNSIANVLSGEGGADTLVGDAGNDWLKGGGGRDNLVGGAGSDNFVFDTTLDARTNVDWIDDFNVAADTIRLDNAVMAGLGLATGALAAGKFWKSTSGLAHDADDRIIYETDTGKLFYDANGIASGGAVHFASLMPNLALTNADFVVL